ncbi:MAG: hypothetical protein Sylvanvirus1_51 [Sylvanvirus sp.]|uniref:Uncharacterized protein n=1 Tax=Sylvanvirus sp. TaxID=2487774 RepID=A0A3G5AGX7_9VIRU|nr:MAG: hypothetical protein Sylvanvirus1_51 [Sylvanvirus sp.]
MTVEVPYDFQLFLDYYDNVEILDKILEVNKIKVITPCSFFHMSNGTYGKPKIGLIKIKQHMSKNYLSNTKERL